MKILQVCAYAAPYEGNFMKSLYALEVELNNKGIKVIYAFPYTAAQIEWNKKLAEDHLVYYLPLEKARIKPSTYSMMRQIYKSNPDIIIAHSHFELYDVPTAQTAPKSVKVFWHLHDSIADIKSKREKAIQKLQYSLFSHKATLLSVSRKHMEYAIKLGFNRKKALWVPNGIDLSRILPVSPSENKEYDFLIFGWDYYIKGIDLCIKAAQKINASFKIAVVCSDNVKKEIVDNFGQIPNFITILKPVTDINQLYGNARCFLHISRSEGLSYALLEAAYAGLPVICSDIEENMFASVFSCVQMVKSGNVESISDAMKKFLTNATSYDEECFHRIRQRIEEQYSMKCWVKNMMRCYGFENT